MSLKFIILLVISSSVNSLVLQCEFKFHHSYWGENYACVVNNITTSETDKDVQSIIGTHLEGKTNDDVEKVFIEKQNCPVLPRNFGTFFPNLKVLYIMKSQVKTLSEGDLDGLDKLLIFDVSYNPIETIPKGFFKGHNHLRKISFYECHLKLIEKGALDHLQDLNEAHFQYNPCINFRADQKYLIPSLDHHVGFCNGKSKVFDRNPVVEYGSEEDNFLLSAEELDQYFKPSEKTTKCEPKIVKEECESKVVTRTEYITKYSQPELSFVQRHTYMINFILICVIAVLVVLNLKGEKYFTFSYNNSSRTQELREDF
jgi:hypothetical protein